MADTEVASARLPAGRGAVVGLACALALGLAALLGAFRVLDLKLQDLRYRVRGPIAASPRIALVEVDDGTIGAYRSWPLPRETYALLIAALEQGGATAIGFDVLFLGESAERSGDELLAAVSREATNVVQAIAFLPEDATLGGGASTTADQLHALLRHGRPLTRQRLASARLASLPYAALLESSDALGHTEVAVDRDGVVRRAPAYVRYGGWAYPSLAIRLVETAARGDSTLPQFELAEDGVWCHRLGRRSRVPVDAEGATAIAFAGDRAAFHTRIPMLRVLQWYRDDDSTALARAFRDRIVLVGATAVGEVATDLGATPFAAADPLVYVHANALDAALRGRFVTRPHAALLVASLLGLGALLGGVFSVLPLVASAVAAVAAVALLAVMDYALFVAGGIDLPLTAALVLPPVVWIAIEGVRRTITERDARERQRELKLARRIQQGLLPAQPPEAPEVDVFGVNLPAEAVGGDYYDWLPLGDDALAVVLGDVSGHGIPAALLMAHLRASFHAEARRGASPVMIVEAMHQSLVRAIQAGKFATFFLAVLSRRESRLRYCNAGHNPPFLIRDGMAQPLPATGFPLAMLEDSRWEEGECEFRPGDVLVLYSDGLPECVNPRRELYGDERWAERVRQTAAMGGGAGAIGATLLDDVRAFARGHPAEDDMTLVVVRRL